MKSTLIITIYNESKSILSFLESITKQSHLPDEIIITDGGSTDSTIEIIKSFIQKNSTLKISLLEKKGNRSIGRNNSITHAKHEIIAVTDAGCTLSNNWFENIIKPFEKDESIDVVSGWYQILENNTWDKILAHLLNFQLDSVNPNTFLPSTRSIAFKKSIWSKINGFDEELSHNEDTPFGLALRNANANFHFEPSAVVYWKAPQSYNSLYRTLHRYAYGDGQARLFLPQFKILTVFWLFLLLFLIYSIIFNSLIASVLLLLILIAYLYLPFLRNLKLITPMEFWVLPLMRIVMLLAATLGYIKGLISPSKKKFFKNNLLLLEPFLINLIFYLILTN